MSTKQTSAGGASINYKLVNRMNPLEPEGAPVVAPLIVYRDEKTLDDLCELIAERSTLCPSDVVQVVQAILTNATMRLMSSEAFNLGSLGYLSTTLKTDLVTDPDAYTRSNIRKARVVFNASPQLRRELSKVKCCLVKQKKSDIEVVEEDTEL